MHGCQLAIKLIHRILVREIRIKSTTGEYIIIVFPLKKYEVLFYTRLYTTNRQPHTLAMIV